MGGASHVATYFSSVVGIRCWIMSFGLHGSQGPVENLLFVFVFSVAVTLLAWIVCRCVYALAFSSSWGVFNFSGVDACGHGRQHAIEERSDMVCVVVSGSLTQRLPAISRALAALG